MSKINVEFPAFNFDWPSSVQIQWLQTYERVCRSGPDKADSALDLALDTIVQKNAEYDHLAQVAAQLVTICRNFLTWTPKLAATRPWCDFEHNMWQAISNYDKLIGDKNQ